MQPNSMQLSVKPFPQTKPTPALSLLDALPIWLDTPELAYSYWLDSQGYKESSKLVYNAMFKRFCTWLTGDTNRPTVRFEHCTEHHIKAFLDSENPALPASRKHRSNTGRQKQQYVRMLERVFVHLGELGLSGPNPGRKAGWERFGAGSDKPTRFLNPAERSAIIGLIETRIAEIRKDQSQQDRWVEVRDLALIGATIGGGMKLQHLKALTLNCIDLTEEVIDASTSAQAHRAVLLPFAVESLRLWIEVLEALTAETRFKKRGAGMTLEQWRKTQTVFIADRRSNGFGRLTAATGMHPSSIFRRIQSFLLEAGISGERCSAQTLRNTYAALLIEGGATDAELVTCLGLATDLTAQRLRVTCTGKKE